MFRRPVVGFSFQAESLVFFSDVGFRSFEPTIRHGVIGNTAAFGAVILGSSPSGGAKSQRGIQNVLTESSAKRSPTL